MEGCREAGEKESVMGQRERERRWQCERKWQNEGQEGEGGGVKMESVRVK